MTTCMENPIHKVSKKEIGTYSENVNREVAEEIKMETVQGTSTEHALWEKKFDSLISNNVLKIKSFYSKSKKAMFRIRMKSWFNQLFKLLHLSFRISTRKEDAIVASNMKEAFLDCFLHMNNLDNNTVSEIEEMRKDRSIEGIRKQLHHLDINQILTR